FTIHSWHDDGSVNEPWMYPGITDIVRNMIRLRYRLIPFLYTLSYLAAERREPIVNPVFSLDDSLLEESDDFLLGRDLLVASVVEEGQATRTVTLPDVPGGWFEFDTGIHHDPGTVTLDAPLDRLPLLVRAGAGIPQCTLPEPTDEIITTQTVENSPHRIVLYLPDGEGHSEGFFFDDDGHTDGYRDGHGYWLTWTADHDATTVTVHTHVEGDYQPPWGAMDFALRPSDDRTIKVISELTPSASNQHPTVENTGRP
ncbi:MAG: glycoside hydrolase family 31 protein, partial [Cutibacterium avidum]|nr:glycoside hydrolase family 31 protein [Cutibacterium avidum]